VVPAIYMLVARQHSAAIEEVEEPAGAAGELAPVRVAV